MAGYDEQMRHFIEAAEGKHPYTLATIEEELHNVRVFAAIVESSKSFRETPVEH